MYTVVGKVDGMNPISEWIADAIPSGTLIGEIAMSGGLISTIPDGMVFWRDGAYLMSYRQKLIPCPEGTVIKIIPGKAHAENLKLWDEIIKGE